MTPAFSARRRADEFEALISRPDGAPLTEADAARFSALLSLVDDLRAVPDVHARPEFVAGLRERLMAEADTVLVPRPARPSAPEHLALPPGARRRQRRLAAVLGGAALVGATGSMAVAAQSAIPGEALYPVKRGIESAQVRLASSDAARGAALLAGAQDRLTELEELAARQDAGSDVLIPGTLDDFAAQADEGASLLLSSYEATGDESQAIRVRAFTAASLERLARLSPQLPASARDELIAAGRALTGLDARAGLVCPTCRGGIAQVPDFLLAATAPVDLLGGLDRDGAGLGGIAIAGLPTPISGQDVTGIEVPEELVLPDADPTETVDPTQAPVGDDPTQAPEGVKDKAKETVTDVGDGVKDTTGDVTQSVDGATGGAIGGLTGGLDDATGGLIGDVTGGLDAVTGNTVSDSTGGLLP